MIQTKQRLERKMYHQLKLEKYHLKQVKQPDSSVASSIYSGALFR